LMAASSEQARLLELFELETDEGPCVACFRTGLAVTDPDLDLVDRRWSRFGRRARQAGYRSVHAEPMRLRDEVIGVLNLFYPETGTPDPADIRIARALADVATIGLLQQRAISDRQLVAEQLQTALNSRIVIEQAKGVLAERLGVNVDTAFTVLRAHARRYNRRLTALAHQVVTGAPSIPDVVAVTEPEGVPPADSTSD
jgi:GAF domain-containing protein